MRSLVSILGVTAGLLAATAQPIRPRLDDLRSNAVNILRRCDGVERVERLVAVPRPKCRIIHIADRHWVCLDDLARDLRDQDGLISDAEIAGEYEAEMKAVRDVQARQRELIRWLVKQHGIGVVHVEGLTDGDMPVYRQLIRAARKGILDDDSLMRLGAAGQMLVAGELAVVPAEDEAAFRAADPLVEGLMAFEGSANDAREAAIVRRLIASGPVSIVVLGAAHDLSAHVRAINGCEYFRVIVRRDLMQ